MKCHERLQIMTLNNITIPLPLDRSDKESPTTDSDDAAEESPMTPSSDCKAEESPTTSDSDPDSTEVESPMGMSSKMTNRSHE